jgi:hypothetical protein
MSVMGQGFKVVTEFVFNADQALNGAELLNKQVEKLSSTADQAINSVANLGIRYAMTFSGATGGILGILGNAIKASDKFRATQIELANTMVANGMKMNGSVITFNDALTQSHFIMDKIVKKGREFGISPDALTNQAKFFNNMLAPKGLAGNNLENAIELARVSMKAAPALGVSEEQSTSGIMAGISGQLSRNTQFGTRLFMEAGDVIKSATGIKDLKEFNKSKPEKRIKALIAGLDKLAGTTEAVEARADTLSARLRTIWELFGGVGSILKPLGDAILPTIKQTLDLVIGYLKNDGAKIIKEMAIFIKGFMKSPKEMLADLMQLRDLSADFGKAISIGGIALTLAHAKELMEFLGGNKYTKGIANFVGSITGAIQKIPLLGNALTNMVNSFQKMFHISLGTGILPFVKTFGMAVARMAGFIGVLLIPIQGLSRALNRIKIESAINAVSIIPKVMEHFNSMITSFKRFMAPITDMIAGWEELFYSLLGGATSFKWITNITGGLAYTLDILSTAFLALWGTLKGIVAGITSIVANITSGNFTGLGADFMDAMDNEFQKTMDAYRKPTLGPNGEAQNTVTNYVEQKITMNNSFKEVLQPDRIAFTIKDQLEKESRNRRSSAPTRATGKMAGAF